MANNRNYAAPDDRTASEHMQGGDIVINQAGTRLYVTNRGLQNTVTVFAIDPDEGLPVRLDQVQTQHRSTGLTL